MTEEKRYLKLGEALVLHDKDGEEIPSAPCDEVAKFVVYVERVLWALGYQGAWVSDKSLIGNFPAGGSMILEASNTLGMQLDLDMKIIDAAKQLAAKEVSDS